MVCAPWQTADRKDGKCNTFPRHCNYNNINFRTQCVEKAFAQKDNFKIPWIHAWWDKSRCLYLGDSDERIPYDWFGWPTAYEVFFL